MYDRAWAAHARARTSVRGHWSLLIHMVFGLSPQDVTWSDLLETCNVKFVAFGRRWRTGHNTLNIKFLSRTSSAGAPRDGRCWQMSGERDRESAPYLIRFDLLHSGFSSTQARVCEGLPLAHNHRTYVQLQSRLKSTAPHEHDAHFRLGVTLASERRARGVLGASVYRRL